MEARPLAVFWALCAALLAGITAWSLVFYSLFYVSKSLLLSFPACHGCSTGKEFITTFLPNARSDGRNDHRLHVVLTAQGSEADVNIQVRIRSI